MICPDCEFEYEKLNKNGICKECAHRKASSKYEKKDYVKIKDLKGTPWYNVIVERRRKKGIFLSTNVENAERKIKELYDNDNANEIAKKVVNDDIENSIQRLDLHKDILEIPLHFIIQAFIRIFDKSIVKEKTLLKNEYEVFIVDRLHKLLDTDDLKEITQIGLEQKYIEQERAFVKKELALYEPFKELVDDLVNDEIFKTKLDTAIEKYNELQKMYENPVYISNTLSMQKCDFVKKAEEIVVTRKLVERRPLKRYSASVPCCNLYGNPEKTLFEANGGILAENEEDAKNKLKVMLKQFNNVFYNEKDIVIKEFSLEKQTK